MRLAAKSYMSDFNLNKVLEISGSVLGVAGAITMSAYYEYAFLAWTVWFLSSLLLAVFAYRLKLPFLLGLQAVFIAVNISGIYNTAHTFL